MVRQHDAARADSYGARTAGDMRDEDGCGRACNARDVVVLREPESAVRQSFGVPGEIETISKRLRCIATFDDGREIEH